MYAFQIWQKDRMYTHVEILIGIVVNNAWKTKPMENSLNRKFQQNKMVTDSIAKKWFKQLLL
jgi:low temperature requirement protein LtrA